MTIHEAAKQGNVGKVQVLLDAGADINAQDDDGMTALHWAAYQDDTALAEVLLSGIAHMVSWYC